MIRNRYLTTYILEDLKEKMVFIGGPRQVGKTTFAREIIPESFKKFQYFNWDYREDRKKVMDYKFNEEAELLIFDEIHKYSDWKNHIKGIYDVLGKKYKILVTGSARLDFYRRGGDSLQGRYHYWKMFPFSLSEFIGKNGYTEPFTSLSFSEFPETSEAFKLLLEFGGFPEPLFKADKRVLRRWHNEKIERMFREDIRDIEMVRDLSKMKLLADFLPEKAGSQLSLNSLREDLEVSFKAVSSWIDILENFYYLFRVYPFYNKKIRSIKKEPKLYLWDWSEIADEGKRFENLIGLHLFKFVSFLEDYEGYKAELFYLRNVDKKEVDFLIAVDRKPWFSVEVKFNDTSISPNLYYFKDRLKIPYNYQIVRTVGVDYSKGNIRVISADKFLTALI